MTTKLCKIIRVPANIHLKIKILAAQQGVSMADFLAAMVKSTPHNLCHATHHRGLRCGLLAGHMGTHAAIEPDVGAIEWFDKPLSTSSPRTTDG